MEQDPFFTYGPNGPAVVAVMNQAAEMTPDQMAATAKTSGGAIGYLGIRKSLVNAQKAMQDVAETHSRTRALVAAKDAGMDSVMRAVKVNVASNGKSDAGIAEGWQDFLAAIADANPRRRQRAYRKLQKPLRDTIGSKVAKAVPVASGAASMAVQVAVVWDLASERGRFTPTDRDLLMSPWLTVYPLPPDLSARA
jgi:NADH:ubiquinone oxidoreductase subunit